MEDAVRSVMDLVEIDFDESLTCIERQSWRAGSICPALKSLRTLGLARMTLRLAACTAIQLPLVARVARLAGRGSSALALGLATLQTGRCNLHGQEEGANLRDG